MDENLQEQVNRLQDQLTTLQAEFDKLRKSDRTVHEKEIELAAGRKILSHDGKAIIENTTDGFIIGESGSKFSFYGQATYAKQDMPSLPSGQANDLDTEARAWITSFHNKITNTGLFNAP